jgi:G3E family GTPase
MKHVSVVLVQGADGAGKSTLVDAQLAHSRARRVARLSARCPAEERTELEHLLATSDISHAIVELGNGAGADSVTARQSFQLLAEGMAIVVDHVCIVTVVDGSCFLRDLVSEIHVIEAAAVRVESQAMMLAEQIEASTVIAVAKADLIPRETLGVLLAVLAELNPAARVVIAQHGHAPALDVFDGSHVELARAWREASRSDVLDPAAHERALTGISSYTYRARRPFHPERLYRHVHQPWPGVLRSRGIFWLATRIDEACVWSQAGSRWQISSGGFWWATLDQRGWSSPPSMDAAIRDGGREPLGDRRQELVLIGVDMDTRALEAAFDACLLSADELAAANGAGLELADPFPSWPRSAPHAGHAPSFEPVSAVGVG